MTDRFLILLAQCMFGWAGIYHSAGDRLIRKVFERRRQANLRAAMARERL